MQRIVATRKEHALLIGLTLVAIAAAFPLAMPEKTITLTAYCLASTIAFLLAITRLRLLVAPAVAFLLILIATFFTPVEIDFAKNKTFGISWQRCVVVGSFDLDRATGVERVIYRGCCPINGIEPVRLLTIHVP
jgi:hypothetical protein